MRFFRYVILVLLCAGIAAAWGKLIYQPGAQSYRAEAIMTLTPMTEASSQLEILRKGKELVGSKAFQVRAVEHLTALQTQRIRELGPDQLVEDFEGSPDSLAESLLRSCTVSLNETTPALVFSVSSESRSFASSILEVLPDLLKKIQEANSSTEQRLLGIEIQQVLSDEEQLERRLTEVAWNLKGALQAKFADRPISKRGATPPHLPVLQPTHTVTSSSITDSLNMIRTKITQTMKEQALPYLEVTATHGNTWDLLEEAFRLRQQAASLVQQASISSSYLDSATSIDQGPLPEALRKVDRDLLELREKREALQQQLTTLISPVTTPIPGPVPVFTVKKTLPKPSKKSEKGLSNHLLAWSLRGTGVGFCLSFLCFVWPSSRKKRA